jgi:cyanate permease
MDWPNSLLPFTEERFMATHLAVVSINEERGTFDLAGETFPMSAVVQVTYDRESRRGQLVVARDNVAQQTAITLSSAWKLTLFMGTESWVSA